MRLDAQIGCTPERVDDSFDFEAAYEKAFDGQQRPREDWRKPGVRADHNCQRRTAQRRRRLGRLLQRIARERLRAGVPLERVLDTFAAGTSDLQRRYERAYGERISRDTLSRDREALLGAPTGVMPAGYSFAAERVVQAHTYTLRHLADSLGTVGRQALTKLVDLALRLEYERPRSTVNTYVGPISLERALERALQQAVSGNRHRVGLHLAWHLARLGVPERHARDVLERYRGAVARIGSRVYERREARRAVESAYRKLASSHRA